MKNIALALSLVLSVNALARSGTECRSELVEQASLYANYSYLANQVGGIPALKDCKNIVFNGDGSYINNKVYITADAQNLIIQNNVSRTLSLTVIPGGVTDWNVMAGRLILATGDQKLVVVSRSGSVLELLSNEGKSFYNVASVKIEPGTEDLIVNFTTGRGARLSKEEVLNRLNDGRRFRAISF